MASLFGGLSWTVSSIRLISHNSISPLRVWDMSYRFGKCPERVRERERVRKRERGWDVEELSWPLSLPHLLNQLPPPQKLTTRRDHEHEHVHKLHIRGMSTCCTNVHGGVGLSSSRMVPIRQAVFTEKVLTHSLAIAYKENFSLSLSY